MALPKPKASKAPAPTQPVGGYHVQGPKDPCCVPAGVDTGAPQNGSSKAQDNPAYMGAQGALGHILNPTAH